MVLTANALRLINKPSVRIRLAMVLGCTEQTIIRYIGSNSDDLTKAASLKVIREETGLDGDDLLEELEDKQAVK